MTERVIVTKGRIYRLAPDDEGVPVGTYFPGWKVPKSMKGAKVYQTPDGPVIARQETGEEAAIDGHVQRYFDLLQAELDRNPEELPASMIFPAPRDEAEKAGFESFVRMAGQVFPTEFLVEKGS